MDDRRKQTLMQRTDTAHPLPSSYYEATVTRPALPRLGARTEQAEVCIVGGGFAGLATALGLVERGLRDIVVLEAERVGFGASGRNGGFVFGGYSLENAELLRLLGERDANALYALTTAAVDLIRRRITRYDIDCDAVHAGIILADWFGRPARLAALRETMREHFGVDWLPIGAIELRQRLKSERYHGGLLEPHGFHFHPLKYLLGLVRALTAAGVRIYEGSPALSIQHRKEGLRVDTPAGSIEAREVVIAAGGYSSGISPAIERAILPIATYVVATEPLGERLKTAMECASAVYDTRFAFDYYRPLPDTRLLWGGRISVFERSPRRIAQLLQRDMLRVYPQLSGVEIEYAWSGLMSYARHKMPQIGRTPDGIWHAIGFGGHGVAPTTVAGERLAAAIANREAIAPAFARFGLVPAYGRLGLAAAELHYLTKIGIDVAAEHIARLRMGRHAR